MQVTFSPRALRDLRAIGDYIAIDSPERSGTFVAEVRVACESLATESNRYALLERPKGYRRMPVGSYLVFYQTTGDFVRIVRVVHSARDSRDLGFN
jgi:toxin ParE1/3/4